MFENKQIRPMEQGFSRQPMSIFEYATNNDLQQTDGWKKVGRMKRNVKFMKRETYD
jgi:hypothetical protein